MCSWASLHGLDAKIEHTTRKSKSGRVGRRYYAHLKAEIELHNIPHHCGCARTSANVDFELLCPAATAAARAN